MFGHHCACRCLSNQWQWHSSSSDFIKPDQRNPWIKDQLGNALLSLPHDTKFGNCRCEAVGRRVIFISSLIHGSGWSGLIKAEPGGKVFVEVSSTVNDSILPWWIRWCPSKWQILSHSILSHLSCWYNFSTQAEVFDILVSFFTHLLSMS